MTNVTVDAEEALRALAANSGNAKKTAKQLGIPRSTLRNWAGRSNAHGMTPSPNMRPAQRTQLAEKWRKVAEKGTAIALEALDGVDPGALAMRDVKDLLVASAVATEKHLLLTGGATSRTETLSISLVGTADLKDVARRAIEARSVPVLDAELVQADPRPEGARD